MGKPIYLKIDTVYGVITIPFLGLREVDDFTVRYDNLKELVMSLIKTMNLDFDLYDTEGVYLTYDKYKRGYDESCLEIKYKSDNFNYDSLINALCEYLLEDPKRIWQSDIRYVKTDGMISFMNTGRISRFEIKNIVNAYLNNYKRKRDMYFFLKNSSKNGLLIKIDKLIEEDTSRNTDLSCYDLEDDSYLSYLIQLYKRGNYEFGEAMEYIAKADLQELEKLLKKDGYGVVDGVSDNTTSMYRDIKMLEIYTGISIENLRLNHSGFGRKKGNKR